MMLNMLKGKIHRATVVQAELDYVDGLTVYGKRPLLVRLFARRPINLFEQF